jgi:hypothetical protein
MKATMFAVTNVFKTRNSSVIANKLNLRKICRLHKQLVMKYKILLVVIVKNTIVCKVMPYILVKIYRGVKFGIKICILLITLTTSRTMLGSDSVWVTGITPFGRNRLTLYSQSSIFLNDTNFLPTTNVASQTAVFFRHIQ